jgi:hypothetical protein
MPSKFSYSDLEQTNDRLKREAQQYLDSLDVNSAPKLEANENVAKDSTGSCTAATVTNDGNSCDSNESDDELPEMAFHGAHNDDDDSLIAMARRLDDASSVISYSSYDVHSRQNEEEPMLALPCSTGNAGLRAKKIYPKEKRFGLEGEIDKHKSRSATRERRKKKQSVKQPRNNVADASKCSDSTTAHKVLPSRYIKPKSRSASRERKRNTKTNNEGDAKWKSNTFYESKQPLPPTTPKQKPVENTKTPSKTVDVKKFSSTDKKTTPKISQWKDKNEPPSTNTKCNIKTWNDSERTVPTGQPKKTKVKKPKSKTRSSLNDSDGESMHGIGCNVRIHDTSNSRKSDKSTRSNSKEKIATARSCTPPPVKSSSGGDKSDNESIYDSDCNTEFFYESTDEEWSSEDELPVMVGTSVLEAVKDLNNQSIGFKMKNMLGIR